MSDLTRLEAATVGLDLPAEGQEADYIGRLDKCIRSLQGHRKTIMDELPGPVSGKEYRIVEERWADRSYNNGRLLDAFEKEGLTIWDLLNMDVLKTSWQWTRLRNLAVQKDIGLRIAGHELVDSGEADHVGEVWKSRYKVEGIK
jgi:hypothetical protein